MDAGSAAEKQGDSYMANNRKPTFGSNPYFFVEGGLFDRHGREVDPGECIIFKVTDKALPATIAHYAGTCDSMGSPEKHSDAALSLAQETLRWHRANPDRVKAAD